jgi:hypothetical protein
MMGAKRTSVRVGGHDYRSAQQLGEELVSQTTKETIAHRIVMKFPTAIFSKYE